MPEQPNLGRSIQVLLKICRDFTNKSPKEVAEFHLAAVGLLCHLKVDQITLLRIRNEQGEGAKWPDEDKIPAIAAVIHNPGLFKALVKCLQTSTGSSKADGGEMDPRPISTTGPMNAGRKRAISSADTDGSSKALKMSHSPVPTPVARLKQPAETHRKKPFINVHVAAATIVYAAFQYLDHWPAPLMKAYAEDAFGARLWVDDERCRLLVENLALAHAENEVVVDEDRLDAAEKVLEVYRGLSFREDRENGSGVASLDRRGSLASMGLASVVQRAASIDSVDSAVKKQLQEASLDSDSGDEQEDILKATTDGRDSSDSSSGDEDEEVMVTTKTGETDQSPPKSARKKRLANGASKSSEQPQACVVYPPVQATLNFSRVRHRYFGSNLEYSHQLISLSLSDRLDVRSKQNSGLLQSLPSFTTIAGVRSLIADNLEKWLQSPALAGLARVLFSSTVQHLKKADPPLDEDLRVIDCVLSMRLKANQLNAHVENVTAIATRIPSAAVAHHIYSKVLREVLATTDAAGNSNSNQLKMFSAVHRAIPSQTSYDAVAATLLKILVNPESLGRADTSVNSPPDSAVVVKKLQSLLRALAIELGSIFNGYLLIDALLSFDVSADSWSARDEENKARLMFQCATLAVGALVHGQNHAKLDDATKRKLRENLSSIRKLLLTWCCMDFGPRCRMQVRPKRFAHPKESNGIAGAPDPPDYSSALSSSSEEKIPFWLNTMRCLLFMEESPALVKRFIIPDGSIPEEDPEWAQERRRIELCCMYGSDLGDEMIWVVLKSHALPKGGIEATMAIQLLEHLFECCSKHRSGSLSVEDPVIVWELYNLTLFSPPHPLEKDKKPQDEKDETTTNADGEEIVSRLAHTGLWWRVTMLALVMCGSSTDAIGIVAWREHPTLQALMKMITSNRYRFPTVDCDDSGRDDMKKFEQAARDKESKIAEKLYLPPMNESTTKRRNTGPRMSRRLLKQHKEKEAAQELAETNRRKKLLKAAQKAIMLWDPDGPARKPPREAADLLLSVEKLFGLSQILESSSDPDFVLLTIGQTTRGAIERAYDWLIPIISRLPDTIGRLPSSASCFLLLRAYGTDGEERAQLKELSTPLLRHVKDSVRGTYGESDSVKAFDLLMSDVASQSADRRRCARRVLKDALEGVGSKEAAPGSWMLDILALEHAALVVSDAVRHMSKAADFERGRVLRSLIVALERHMSFAMANKIDVEQAFSSLLFRLISNRPSILAEAMNSFSDLRSLTIRVVHSEVAAYTRIEQQKKVEDEARAVSIRLHATSISTDGQEVTLPLTLLESTAVVFSIWKEDSHEVDTDAASAAAVDDLVNALTHDETHTGDEEIGLSGAIMQLDGTTAMPVESWIMLAKARNDNIAKRAALSAPTGFLPRLLLCSGLPRTSLLTMVDRLGRLGDGEGKNEDVYVKLLVPSASSEWDTGRVGHRRDLARRLLGRLAAYMRLNKVHLKIGESEVSTKFLDWLVKECKSNEKPKKKPKKSSKKVVPPSLRNIDSASTVLACALDLDPPPAPLDEDDMDFEFTQLDPTRAGTKDKDQNVIDDAHTFIGECLKENLAVKLNGWLETAPWRDSQEEGITQGTAAVCMLQAYQSLEHSQEALRMIVLKWVPVLTKIDGDCELWSLVFSETNIPSYFALDLVAKCVSYWSPTHVSKCVDWILRLKEDAMVGLSVMRLVEFLVQSSAQSSSRLEEFNSGTTFTGSQWLNVENAVVSSASLAVQSMIQCDTTSDRNSSMTGVRLGPGQHLLLLLGKTSRKNMIVVVDAVMRAVSKMPQGDYGPLLLEETLLRLYLVRPAWMSLGSQVLRESLMRATEARAGAWSEWPCMRDDSLADMMEALRTGDYRYTKNLVDVARQHPLLMVRKLATVQTLLEVDATIVLDDERDVRGIVSGHALGGPYEAKVPGDGKIVKVNIRHWGFAYTEPLWVAFLDIVSTIHPSVLFGCALNAGLLDFWAIYLQLLSVQLQLLTAEKAQRIKSKMASMFKACQKENLEAWKTWLGSSIGTSEVRHLLMSCDFITPQEAIESLRHK